MSLNALIDEKSPYLRQHAHNPVQWLPWGEAAFAKARAEDKPIFLSVGYSTCHWCHVMAHESFENDAVAELLNRDFVPIKVDREERPDVDRVYMLFVQASTGSGGWPMSVWLTPELRPFFGGTYFPPDSRYGRPGFRDVLRHLAEAWKQDRSRIEGSSVEVLDQLRAYAGTSSVTLQPDQELFESAFHQFRRTFDSKWGGFGGAPKFPRPVAHNYLLRFYSITQNGEALEMVTETLSAMARGGMHDQLGGGFHRYSVDERWFLPHFEKMLYDQAQLAVSYLEAYQITSEPKFAETARRIFDYVLRDLTDEAGGFYSAEDADSPDFEKPGHNREGAFYVWRQQEIDALLQPAAARAFSLRYGVQPLGNVEQDPQGEFVGQNILHQERPFSEGPELDFLEAAEQRLFEVRGTRPRPHLDNKVLTSWNALMISALAKSYAILGEPVHLEAAERAFAFLLSTMCQAGSGTEGSRLLRRYCEGDAAVPGFLDDYAFLIQAGLDLFEVTGKHEYLRNAAAWARGPLAQFEDVIVGGFFSTAEQSPDLVLRIKDDYDGAEPSGNSVATDVLLRLSHLTGDQSFGERAKKSLHSFAPKVKAQPTIAPQMLVALGRSLTEPSQIVIRCEQVDAQTQDLLEQYRASFTPYGIVLALSDHETEQLREISPFLHSLERRGSITMYECRNFVCQLPKVLE